MSSQSKRFTRHELIENAGVTEAELGDLEMRGLVVPNWNRRFLGRIGPRREYFTQGQVEVVGFLIRVRRVLESNRLSPSGAVSSRTQPEDEE